MKKFLRFLIVPCILVGIPVSYASAQVKPRLEIVANGASLDVFIHPDRVTTLLFSSAIEDAKRPPWDELDFEQKPDRITLRPQALPPRRDVLGSFNVHLADAIVTINLRAAPDVTTADKLVLITPRAQWTAWEAAVQEACIDRSAGTSSLDEPTDERRVMLAVQLARDQQRLRDVIAGQERVPIDHEPPSADQQGVFLWAEDWVWSDGYWHIHFKLSNRSDRIFEVESLRVMDGDEDRAGGFALIDRKGRAGREIPAGTEVEGAVLVRHLARVEGLLTLMIREPDRDGRPGRAVKSEGVHLPVIVLPPRPPPPKTPEQLRDERVRGRITLQLKMLGGVIWLPSGISGDDPLAMTSLKGLGVRVTYGYNRFLSVEAEAAGAASGTATFRDITFGGQPGDLQRDATVFRSQFGAVFSLGEKIVPSLRVGVGAQGVSHDALLMTLSGERMPGPDIVFDFSGLWYAGIGLDLHISDRLVANLAITAENPVDSDTRSFEAGLHIGYGWPP